MGKTKRTSSRVGAGPDSRSLSSGQGRPSSGDAGAERTTGEDSVRAAGRKSLEGTQKLPRADPHREQTITLPNATENDGTTQVSATDSDNSRFRITSSGETLTRSTSATSRESSRSDVPRTSSGTHPGQWQESLLALSAEIDGLFDGREGDGWIELRGMFGQYRDSEMSPEQAVENLDAMVQDLAALRNAELFPRRDDRPPEEATASEAIKNKLAQISALLHKEIDHRRYQRQRAAGTAAFAGDGNGPRYLNITPAAGSGEALSGGGWKPRDIPLDQQYRAALPRTEDGNIDIEIAGEGTRTLEFLVASGGHGGDGALFQRDDGGAFDKPWWAGQVQRLVARGVQARVIVLDACLSASMIDTFKPLLAEGGSIIGYTYSINQMLFTPEFWGELANAQPETIGTRIKKRLAAHTEGNQGTLGEAESPLAMVIPTAIYSVRNGIRYDARAVSVETEGQLREKGAYKDANEMRQMRTTLNLAGAVPIEGFVPDLEQTQGKTVIAETLTKTRAELEQGGWLDHELSPIDGNTELKARMTIYDSSNQAYTLTNEGDKFGLTPSKPSNAG